MRQARIPAGDGVQTGALALAKLLAPPATQDRPVPAAGENRGTKMPVRPIQGGRSGHRADGNVATATTGPREGGDAVRCICRCSASQFAVRVRLGQPGWAIIWAG